MATGDQWPVAVRACWCVGYLTNPDGRCCMDLRNDARGRAVTTDRITIHTPKDDPQSPLPSPMAGSWQCGGCGTIYSPYVNKCECQKRNLVSSAGSTTGITITSKPVSSTFTSEMP